ncbi:MAG: aspartate/tyrosine/aromatic aminotransferase [Actinobacteria bacterium BACL15 MAG-120619-bin91]|uniref:Aminotransferase n=2 Tax=ac1 cluster TaxID=1655545 RepID=A0A0R2PJH4_9ACTN|nr:MAG: aspartate/tyrosine/aromatic aminotransferase [Actinobacteria bacterium BACL15 MAG-120619-bin91]KRO38103.1 MAG: aspartate/tyrosine/aromatic aminotransferase [Actinobacteria bacterium BACL15 MAG-120823-bin78]
MRAQLPDFPWDALAPYGQKARSHPQGIIDLSQGTPVDPTPEFIQQAFRDASNSPSYPVTAGTPELRAVIEKWAIERLGASGDFDVLPVIGSKELVAWLPTFLESTTVLIPEIAYPTYHVGAVLAGADSVPVEIDANTWPKADLAWLNSPSNPTGRVHSVDEIKACINWSRKNTSVLISDECYLEFDHTAHSVSVLSQTGGDNTNILAVHSLSKRSSMAGYRAAFVVGDSALISQIREIRKHGGMMVPLPVQKAMTVALGDDLHVAEQRARYNARKDAMRPALVEAGFTVEFSDSGLYLWCTRNEDAWTSVAWLAERGILATPGSFYGQKGKNHIRIAMTASDTHIAAAVARLKA